MIFSNLGERQQLLLSAFLALTRGMMGIPARLELPNLRKVEEEEHGQPKRPDSNVSMVPDGSGIPWFNAKPSRHFFVVPRV